MREIPFCHIQDIAKNFNDRPLTLFGAGNIAEKTHRLLPEYQIKSIADNASNLWGEVQLDNISVVDPSFLKKEGHQKNFVIICTTSFIEVSQQLNGFGYLAGRDYVVSPVLNDLRIISELESIKNKLIFSSGSPIQDSNKFGGGIYSLEIDEDNWEHNKVISGNCYGIIKHGENFVSVDTERGVFEFNSDFEILREKPLPAGTRAHGIAYAAFNNSFYVVGSYLDAVIQLDANDFSIKGRIPISNKLSRLGHPSHHCNDCCVVGSSLYVSMFSLTGNWKLDVFDGGVLEIDLTENKIIGTVIDQLWMPHNVSYHGGSLVVLDSLPGYLRKNNSQIVGQFSAFTRGLAYDGKHFYIGQSRNRNFSKNLGISNNISIDTSIVIFDELTKVSRSLQLPSRLSEIHSIVLI